jgi:lipoprotein NlpI
MRELPGWKTKIDEIRNGVFKVTLTNAYGNVSEVIDSANEETVQRAISGAFDIEKQVSKNWNYFLYEFYLSRISEEKISKKEYDDSSFGSWLIENAEKRIIYNGKDSSLIFEIKSSKKLFERIFNKKEWVEKENIEFNNINFFNAFELAKKLNE